MSGLCGAGDPKPARGPRAEAWQPEPRVPEAGTGHSVGVTGGLRGRGGLECLESLSGCPETPGHDSFVWVKGERA